MKKKLIKRTAEVFADSPSVTIFLLGEKGRRKIKREQERKRLTKIFTKVILSRGSRVSDLLRRDLVVIVKECRERERQHAIGPFRVHSEGLPAYDGLVSKKIQKKIALKELQAP